MRSFVTEHEVKYVETQLHLLSGDLLEQYLDFQEQFIEDLPFYEIIQSRSFLKKLFVQSSSLSSTHRLYLVIEGSIIIGVGVVDYNPHQLEGDHRVAWMQIDVLADHRKQGIAAALLQQLYNFATTDGCTDAVCIFFKESSKFSEKFVTKKLKFKKNNTNKLYRLYHDQINWKYIEKQEKKFNKLSNKFDFEKFDTISYNNAILTRYDFAEQIIAFETNLIEDVPWGISRSIEPMPTVGDLRDLAKASNNATEFQEWVKYLVFQDNMIVGLFRCSFVNEKPVRSIIVGSMDIRTKFLNSGLATFLRIRALQDLLKNYLEIEFIQTDRTAMEEEISVIDDKLGFKFELTKLTYSGKLDQIQSYLIKKRS